MDKREFDDDLTNIWFKIGIVFGALLILAVVLFIFWGEKIAFGGVECGFYKFIHMYCPGCGGTRAFYHLMHGHIFTSFIMNPFVIYTIVDYIIFMINTILVKTTKKLGFAGFPVTGTIYAGIIILFGQWIVRNIFFLGFHITCL